MGRKEEEEPSIGSITKIRLMMDMFHCVSTNPENRGAAVAMMADNNLPLLNILVVIDTRVGRLPSGEKKRLGSDTVEQGWVKLQKNCVSGIIIPAVQ